MDLSIDHAHRFQNHPTATKSAHDSTWTALEKINATHHDAMQSRLGWVSQAHVDQLRKTQAVMAVVEQHVGHLLNDLLDTVKPQLNDIIAACETYLKLVDERSKAINDQLPSSPHKGMQNQHPPAPPAWADAIFTDPSGPMMTRIRRSGQTTDWKRKRAREREWDTSTRTRSQSQTTSQSAERLKDEDGAHTSEPIKFSKSTPVEDETITML
ncbi:hypothetical protein BC567DRAFT_213681 [Phyllosticta citribraziliensis]